MSFVWPFECVGRLKALPAVVRAAVEMVTQPVHGDLPQTGVFSALGDAGEGSAGLQKPWADASAGSAAAVCAVPELFFLPHRADPSPSRLISPWGSGPVSNGFAGRQRALLLPSS